MHFYFIYDACINRCHTLALWCWGWRGYGGQWWDTRNTITIIPILFHSTCIFNHLEVYTSLIFTLHGWYPLISMDWSVYVCVSIHVSVLHYLCCHKLYTVICKLLSIFGNSIWPIRTSISHMTSTIILLMGGSSWWGWMFQSPASFWQATCKSQYM